MAREYYFAYGSNMDEEQMARRCPGAIKVCPGILIAHRFAIDQAGVATVIKDPGSFVQGILWSVTQKDIINLDLYEGVPQKCYRKDYHAVLKLNKRSTIIDALVYASCRPEWDKPSGTGSIYMRNILKSAFQNQFMEDYLQVLMKYDEADIISEGGKALPVESV